MKKVELLAPAGNYEALMGAFAAGADAVYLGGNAFGARAYADNFSKEEIIDGIHFAHMLDKRIYLTVNTLVKEKELPELYDFLLPFYENGLDGAIIQDLGVLSFIKKNFPRMERHVSTQMTVTGKYGAKLLKEEGAARIVPARELSLEEIRAIKETVDIEIESFVHGAMCYCYSGQCLFSSILGGRSGNRGRCAQPCRLPYRIENGKEQYPLSMKDMCTITILPELIEAGIDSFKIEGRMKKPEYAAGVTAIYRKYIDMYYENPAGYRVSDEDLEFLRKLYIRSDIQEGYYHMHNGREMITLHSPAYAGSDDALLAGIREAYIDKKIQIPVSAHAVLKEDEPATYTLSWDGIVATAKGDDVQKAKRQPLSSDKIKEQLCKSGNTFFSITSFSLDADDDIFMPVAALNQLRRTALEKLKIMIHMRNMDNFCKRTAFAKKQNDYYGVDSCAARRRKNGLAEVAYIPVSESERLKRKRDVQLHVLVGSEEQAEAAVSCGVSRIFVDKVTLSKQFITRILQWKKESGCEFYLAFPQIVRKKDEKNLTELYEALESQAFDGALIRNLETLSFLKNKMTSKPLVFDNCMYTFNREAYHFFSKNASEIYLPLELNKFECQDIFYGIGCRREDFVMKSGLSAVVYGRIPMMISANCLKKTSGTCNGKCGYVAMKDRYQKEFPVYSDCRYCYNIIYNSVPLSLHKVYCEQIKKGNLWSCRLDFTVETKEETTAVIEYFKKLKKGYSEPFYKEFTTGHVKRGVE